ncbi:hypothetical protein QAD02_010919 [Eretmocerus hayati]|uniref:Uncharacterized protein n=1 Tax=Eretmocerus hayati TaxID=131215 RepID=A0ACC2NWA0_9HYME|nr:hypothetical protein QAD02_010919 [Eretmocerus hayati]
MKFMPVRINFPLKRRFAEFFLKLSESGLMLHHETLEVSQWYSDENMRRARGEIPEMYKHYGPENDKDEEVSLNLRLLIILVPGYVLGCVVLIWEIFFQSQRPVEFEKLNSNRKRFVRCLVEEANSKIEEESIREFDFIQYPSMSYRSPI